MFDGALEYLHEMNTGCMPDGRRFRDVSPHFFWGGDESGFQASGGDVNIIGDKRKAKHELPTGTSRTSMTLYRTGNAAGTTGPTAFLPPGKTMKAGYSDVFLERHGAAPGSCFAMTKSGYMTEDAWVEIAPKIAAGIRAAPVVCDMPDWWVVKVFDGFGPHTSNVKAMQIYADAKIRLLKEEGDASHVNQAYDQEVARADKRSSRGALAFVRSTTALTRHVVDGWCLVHVCLAVLRALEPDAWISSFKKVNLHPHHRVGFVEWCKRIEHFLVGGKDIKEEELTDNYTLLPSFWHGTAPNEKMRVMKIYEENDSAFSTQCIEQLRRELGFPLSDMQDLRLCIELATEDPSHLDRGFP